MVALQTSNDYFCSQDAFTSIDVVAMPVVEASFDLGYECNDDLEISIIDNSNSYTDLVWDLGDGNSLVGTQNSYEYSNEGEYVVSLVATNPESCNGTSTSTFVIEVAQPPIVEFSTIPNADCEAGIVEFQNLSFISSFDNVINWNWDFGDGATSQSYSMSHVYLEEDVYYVSLSVETDLGCEDSFGENIDVGFLQKPIPLFTYTIDSCTREVEFMNESILSDSYVWNLDGEESVDVNPVMSVEIGDVYTVSLIASNEFCSEELVQVIDYNAESVYQHVVVPNVFTPNGDSNNDLMYISGLNECEPASLKIFNRWGAEVFHTLSPIAVPWSGVNHSNEVVEGVYFYLLELEHLSITGYVTIFR